MKIRPPNEDDIAAMKALAERVWTDAYEDVLSDTTIRSALDEWYSAEFLGEQLDHPHFYVAEDDGALVGVVHAMHHGDHGEILKLYVLPERQRTGVGTKLLEQVESDLERVGVDRLVVEVFAENLAGTAFYQHHGFELKAVEDTIFHGELVEQNRLEKEVR